MDKDFEVFYQEDPEDSPALTCLHLVVAQVSTSQEALNVTEAMVLEEKTPDLLALLTAHAGGDSLMVPIVPCPPTPALAQIATLEATKKKKEEGKGYQGHRRRRNFPAYATTTHQGAQNYKGSSKERHCFWNQQKH